MSIILESNSKNSAFLHNTSVKSSRVIFLTRINWGAYLLFLSMLCKALGQSQMSPSASLQMCSSVTTDIKGITQDITTT